MYSVFYECNGSKQPHDRKKIKRERKKQKKEREKEIGRESEGGKEERVNYITKERSNDLT